jgi:hypothetical protein
VDDLFLIAAGVQIYLTSAANRHVPGEECIAIDEKRGDLLPSGGRKTDYGQRRLLRPRRERPCSRRSSNSRDEIASSHCLPQGYGSRKDRGQCRVVRHRRSNQEIATGGIGALICLRSSNP